MPIPKYYVRPDGLHESIIRVNGKRKAFRGKTDREVWNKIKAYRAEAEKPKTATFESVAHAWWSEIEPTLAPNSLRNYSPAYERAVAQFGPEDVATITSKEVETYINQFAKTHAKKTVITQRQIIRQILNKAQREGHVSFNAAQSVLLPKNLPQKRRHAPPADQIQKIKDNVTDDFGLFAFLIYYTGCRRGEAEGLRYEDIDREKGRIYIAAVSTILARCHRSKSRRPPPVSALFRCFPRWLLYSRKKSTAISFPTMAEKARSPAGTSPINLTPTASAPASPSPRMRSATATRPHSMSLA